MILGILATMAAPAFAGGCLDGTRVTLSPGVEACVADGSPAIVVRRGGQPAAWQLPAEPPVLQPVSAADLDGDGHLEWVLVQRCATGEACSGGRTWIVDADPGPDGQPVQAFELAAGDEVEVARGLVLVVHGDRAECTTLHHGAPASCGTFTRSSP